MIVKGLLYKAANRIALLAAKPGNKKRLPNRERFILLSLQKPFRGRRKAKHSRQKSCKLPSKKSLAHVQKWCSPTN